MRKMMLIKIFICFSLPILLAQSNDSINKFSNKFNHFFSIDIGRSDFINKIPGLNQNYFNTTTLIHQVDLNYNILIRFFLIGTNLNMQFHNFYGNEKFLNINIGLFKEIKNKYSIMIIGGANYLFSSEYNEGNQRYLNIIMNYTPQRIKHLSIGIGFQMKNTFVEKTFITSPDPKAIRETYFVYLRGLFLKLSYFFNK